MADNVDKLGLDASDLIAALSQVTNMLKQHTAAVEQTAITYVKMNKEGDAVRAGFEATTAAGQKIEGILQNVNGAWEASAQKITMSTAKLKEFAQAAKDLDFSKGVTNSADFLK